MKLLGLILLAALIWTAGLFAFAARVAGSTPALEPPVADGIVALTGASNVRLEAATQLIEKGLAKRLLISGVNKGTPRAAVKEVSRGFGRVWDCCVDLGFQAETTRGNAEETQGWVRYHGYHSLTVVTADYHMPRAMLELKAQMPTVQLYAYPVVTDLNARRWWSTSLTARRMAVEYCKYLVILGREGVRHLGGRPAGPGPADTLQPAGEAQS